MTYIIEVPEEHLLIIGAALNELPYRVAAPVVQGLQAQVTAQEKERAEEEAHAPHVVDD